MKGKTIALRGLWQRDLGHLQEGRELGAKVVTLSGPDGYIYDPDGVCNERRLTIGGDARQRPATGEGLR